MKELDIEENDDGFVFETYEVSGCEDCADECECDNEDCSDCQGK